MGVVLFMRVGAVATCVAACAPALDGPDAHELANFDTAHLLPKSTPRQMVTTFEKACLNDGIATEPAMRELNYVPFAQSGGIRSYVVDDRRPTVLIGANVCAVAAASRTGQTDALAAMVVERFADAQPLDAAVLARIGAERGWLTDQGILFLRRQMDEHSRVIFGISRAA